MALNEMIAQGAQFNMPDPVAQYNKLAQMQQYQSQNELNRQEAIDKATERQRIVSERSKRSTFLTQFGAKLAEKGVALNKTTVADMISSGVPEIEKLGFKALEAMQFDESYNTAMGVGGGGAANAPAPAPAPAPMAAATPIPTSGVSPSNIGAETFVSTGVGRNFNGTATKFNPTTGEIEPVPLRENQAAAGLFDFKTKTYSPVFGTLALTAPQILTRLNNKLAALTNNPPEGMTPQMRAEMIAATKEEIIATAAGKRDMFTPTNEMAPQAPAAAAVTNAMAPAPTPIPTAAPASELERLIAQRSKLSRIRPENPGDIAKLKNTLEGIDKQIEVLNRQEEPAVRIARAIAATVAPLGTAENLAAYNKALKEQTDKSRQEEPAVRIARAIAATVAPLGTAENLAAYNKALKEQTDKSKDKINIIGVAKGTGNPVYLDSISDEQYIYVTGSDGKQKRKLYSGPVDRSTSNVTATANARLPPLESAERKGKGELNVSLYKVISDAARLATKTLPALETQAKILDSGFKTGFGTETQKAAASLLSALGVPEATKFATDSQTFLAATQQAVLQKQLEQKGPQTESDAKRITDTGAQLGNTVEANRFIVDVAKAQFKRDLNQRGFFDKWWTKNETYEGAEDAWFNGEGGKSLFDAPELTKYVASKRSEADAILRRK